MAEHVKLVFKTGLCLATATLYYKSPGPQK